MSDKTAGTEHEQLRKHYVSMNSSENEEYFREKFNKTF
jgi:hypothetical protein